MNKFVKLPLFLGISGAICAGALALVDSGTAKRISENNERAQNQNIYKIMGVDEGKVAPVIFTNNYEYIKEIIKVSLDGTLIGLVYKTSFNDGYTDWIIQLGIKDSTFSGLEYTNGAKVDANVGIPAIVAFQADIVGTKIDESLTDVGSSATALVTLPMLRDFASECAEHYTSYEE